MTTATRSTGPLVSRRTIVLAAIAVPLAAVGSAYVLPQQTATAATADVAAAIQQGSDAALSSGITQYITVIDANSGEIVAETANAAEQVASESLVKLFIAAYYLRQYGGTLPTDVDTDLGYMIEASDDGTASAYWDSDIVPTIASAYGLTNTYNPTTAGYWGATRVNAHDLATFLQRAGRDSEVGSWLLARMSAATDYGSDGFDQNFGLNAIEGAASKQGWGSDSYWVGPNAVHSVGKVGDVYVAILQTGGSGTYGSMPGTATTTASLIASAVAVA